MMIALRPPSRSSSLAAEMKVLLRSAFSSGAEDYFKYNKNKLLDNILYINNMILSLISHLKVQQLLGNRELELVGGSTVRFYDLSGHIFLLNINNKVRK